jgi:hypothetical protein
MKSENLPLEGCPQGSFKQSKQVVEQGTENESTCEQKTKFISAYPHVNELPERPHIISALQQGMTQGMSGRLLLLLLCSISLVKMS